MDPNLASSVPRPLARSHDSVEPPPGISIADDTEIERRAAEARAGVPGVPWADVKRALTREREVRGQRFAGAVARTLDMIALLPLAYPLLQAPDIRSANVRHFPCRVVYVVIGGNVDVLAVAHAKRRADDWHRRIP